ncbi:MAG TPA: NAD(+)/NADH kinase [Bacteroidales bacterium]|jgi:NAD+ kinase|nr:NAD(+)/NADH kinase [Bacteroidales bacterium]
MLKSVAIYSKESNPRTASSISTLVREFCKRGIRILIYQRDFDTGCSEPQLIGKFDDIKALDTIPDLVLSVGGDGTFLETMLRVREYGIPIAGVNAGRMGFLANISEDDIASSVELLCRGRYKVLERSLIELRKPEGVFDNESSVALNEVTVQKADPSMITITVYVDGVHLNTYWADGLIVSTATGSTAYNLSVGGPILSPEDESLIISPISPHNLTIRPIVISGNSVLRMVVEGRSCEYLATCDFRSRRLPFSEEILICHAEKKLKTVMPEGRDFYSTLRNKLMWGADRRN